MVLPDFIVQHHDKLGHHFVIAVPLIKSALVSIFDSVETKCFCYGEVFPESSDWRVPVVFEWIVDLWHSDCGAHCVFLSKSGEKRLFSSPLCLF